MSHSYIDTLDFGRVPVLRTHTEGITQIALLMSDGTCFEVRCDYTTNQPFAVEVGHYDEIDKMKG